VGLSRRCLECSARACYAVSLSARFSHLVLFDPTRASAAARRRRSRALSPARGDSLITSAIQTMS